MRFPSDPFLARLTLNALSRPVCSVAKADLLAVIERVGLKGSAVWDAVAVHEGQWMTVDTAVVTGLLERVA